MQKGKEDKEKMKKNGKKSCATSCTGERKFLPLFLDPFTFTAHLQTLFSFFLIYRHGLHPRHHSTSVFTRVTKVSLFLKALQQGGGNGTRIDF